MNKLLYFAYGSNMWSARIRSRVGEAQFKGCYRLYGYKLAFDGGTNCYANLKPSDYSNDFVEGVLYELDDRQISVLDRFEGYPFTYQKFYKIDKDRVIFGYWDTRPIREGLPDFYYLDYLIWGCEENKLTITLDILIQIKATLKPIHRYTTKYLSHETDRQAGSKHSRASKKRGSH